MPKRPSKTDAFQFDRAGDAGGEGAARGPRGRARSPEKVKMADWRLFASGYCASAR